jgi:8-oxo-dGTP diphosphatase
MQAPTRTAQVRAAGGVLWRHGAGGEPETCLVHRPKYDDWSVPKGKLDPGEGWKAAALREVLEETGVRGRLGAELPPSRYPDRKGRDKLVRYWLMEVERDDGFAAGDEVDELAWLSFAAARGRATSAADRRLLEHAARLVGRRP